MKDPLTLSVLSRQIDLRLKEAQIEMHRIEDVLRQRQEVEKVLLKKIEDLEFQANQEKLKRKNLYLSGSLGGKKILESEILTEIETLENQVKSIAKDRLKAENRLIQKKVELQAIYMQKEGMSKVEDARSVEDERVRIEKLDSN